MAEKTSCITGRSISYEGLFSVADLCGTVDRFLDKRGYGRTVGSSSEAVKPKGKFIMLNLTFKRYVHGYTYYHIDVNFQFENITVVEVVQDGKKTKMNKGLCRIGVDSWVITDYEKSWEANPTWYFIRTLASKFFFKSQHDQWVSDVKRDVKDLMEEIGSYLNLQQIGKRT